MLRLLGVHRMEWTSNVRYMPIGFGENEHVYDRTFGRLVFIDFTFVYGAIYEPVIGLYAGTSRAVWYWEHPLYNFYIIQYIETLVLRSVEHNKIGIYASFVLLVISLKTEQNRCSLYS